MSVPRPVNPSNTHQSSFSTQMFSTLPAQTHPSLRSASMGYTQHQAAEPWNSSSLAATQNAALHTGLNDFGYRRDQQGAEGNVEMASIYIEQPVDETHMRWTSYFREKLEVMRGNLGRWEETLKRFEEGKFEGRTSSREYQGALQQVASSLGEMHEGNRRVAEEITTYIGSLQAVEATEPMAVADSMQVPDPIAKPSHPCSQCQMTKLLSDLSCPSHHVLCLDCAATKYLAKDLKCLCGCLWSQEQCRSLHQALLSCSPELASSLPSDPFLPLDEVQCQQCKKIVGLRAIDQFICSKSHNICRLCAKKLGQYCPECARLGL